MSNSTQDAEEKWKSGRNIQRLWLMTKGQSYLASSVYFLTHTMTGTSGCHQADTQCTVTPFSILESKFSDTVAIKE